MRPYFLVAYNWIRFFLKKHLHCRDFVAAPVELLGWNTRLSLSKTSHVILGGHLVSDGRLVLVAGENAFLTIGDGTYFNEGTMISSLESVSIGTGCRFGPGVKIFDNNHRFSAQGGVSQEHTSAPISIGNRCWLGANVIILKGTQIEDHCVIGAGCVVQGNIPAGSIVTQPHALNIRQIRANKECP